MKTEIIDIQTTLQAILTTHTPTLQVRVQNETTFEVAGTKEVLQGKKKVDGHYFATVMQKPKDCRFYFFPIYTHVDAFKDISPELRKYLKGKSCFHIKKLSADLETEIGEMIAKGVELYLADELI